MSFFCSTSRRLTFVLPTRAETAYLLVHEANEAADTPWTPRYLLTPRPFALANILNSMALKIQIGTLPQANHPSLDLSFSLDDVSPPVAMLSNYADRGYRLVPFIPSPVGGI